MSRCRLREVILSLPFFFTLFLGCVEKAIANHPKNGTSITLTGILEKAPENHGTPTGLYQIEEPIGHRKYILHLSPELENSLAPLGSVVQVSGRLRRRHTINVNKLQTIIPFVSDSTPSLSPAILPDANSRVVKKRPNTHYRTSTQLIADSLPLQWSYVRFTVTGVSGLVQSAKLRFSVSDSSNDAPKIYSTDSSWDESTITWNNKPLPQTLIDDKGAVPLGWIEYDVTSLVQGNGAFSFVLVPDSYDSFGVGSRESALPPQLLITTTDATPTPNVTDTPTLTPVPTSTSTTTAFPTMTNSPTPISTSTTTKTPTPTATPTQTSTSQPTSNSTPVPTLNPTKTSTATPSKTQTQTATATKTATLTATPTASTGKVYCVSGNGSNSNSGDCSHPFATINYGVTKLAHGDTLYIRAGTYSEALINNIPSGTSWNSPVTIAAYPGEIVTLQPATQTQGVIQLAGSFHYIVFDHLILDAQHIQAGFPVVYISYASNGSPHHIRIINSELKNSPSGQGILIENNVSFPSADYNELINNKIHDNGSTDFNHGIYIQSNYNLLDGLDVYNNAGWGMQIYMGSGVNGGSGNCSHNIVRNSKFHDNARVGARGVGVGLYKGVGNLVYNNLIWNNVVGMAVAYGATDTKIYNNTIYANRADAGIIVGYSSGATNTAIKNNIIYKNTNGDIKNYGTNTVSDHNLLNTTDPKFVDETNHDFHLQSSSPAINAGVTLSEVLNDFDGISRPQPLGGAFDIGAFEYH